MSETAKQGGVHYAFFILAGCCCVAAGGVMALVVSMMSIYLVPVSEALGMTRPEFTMWNTTMGFVQILSLLIWGQFIAKNLKLCFTIGVLCELIGIIGFIFVTNVAGMIVIGVFIGFAMPMTFKLIIPTLISNWFAPSHSGRFMGIAMAFTGVGTFVWAPLFTAIIGAFGYKTSYLINAILAAVLCIPWIFVFVHKPEEKGLKPYGWTEEGAAADAEKKASINSMGMTTAQALKTPVFWLLFIAIGAVACGNGFNNNMRPMAAEMLKNTDLVANTAMIAATMVSTGAVGNLLGKIAYGYTTDKLGLKVATIIFLIMFLLAFVCWAAAPGNMIVMYVGAFLLGTHNGIASVAVPQTARAAFGTKNYAKIYSKIGIAQAIIGGSATTIVTSYAASCGTNAGIAYQAFGMAFVVVLGIVLLIAMSLAPKYHAKWDPEGKVPMPGAKKAA